jgi:tRNA (uracil-5-)-methyltransferase TRM9
MEEATVARLNDINREFYRVTAESFDETRRRAWPGWERLLPYLTQLRSPLAVLDIGCGNGRFGVFLAEKLGGAIRYHGVDNNAALLEHARSATAGLEPHLENRDIIENPPNTGTYDLVVLFGVLHHVPGAAQRRVLMHTVAQRVAPGGVLAFACWRFYEYERFRQRLVPWPPDLAAKVELGDYLFDWRRGDLAAPALRYCHYIDDDEHNALVAVTGMTEMAIYRADGESGDANRYSVLCL